MSNTPNFHPLTKVKISPSRGRPYRISSDNVWPLRREDGTKFYERKKL